MRHTIKVEDIREHVNHLLENQRTVTAVGQHYGTEFRLGVASVLEYVLRATGNYTGYRYLSEAQMVVKEPPGVILHTDPDANEFPDRSRRRYF
ncbi:hypothetical protein LCGC14_2966680 [marine sediment metagenome]|uniref:Uncharacterized protein n=1 Tax=marine sediment metagenome TaxID=412755 RepID=A0A0F8XAL1_9ZZZZ